MGIAQIDKDTPQRISCCGVFFMAVWQGWEPKPARHFSFFSRAFSFLADFCAGLKKCFHFIEYCDIMQRTNKCHIKGGKIMKFFIDTANVDEIRKANDMGIIAGVTTNPSLIAKEGRDYAETLAEIATIVDGPISGEVKATTVDAETMVAEGEAIYALDPKHMVVKIPMTAEGLKAIKALSAKGIPTNCTLVFSANQALLAARAGATYVSPFLGRLDDIGQPGIELIETIHDMFLNYPDIDTQIIAASVRNPIHVTDCALAGADIATVPYKVLEQMIHHPLTDAGIEKFKADYIKVFGE
jgi:transaldolase